MSQFDFGEVQAAAATLRVELHSFEVAQPGDFDGAFKDAAARSVGTVVLSGPLIFTHRQIIVEAAIRHKVPAVFYDTEYAEVGGLASYGPSLIDLHHSAAIFVDKISKGRSPLICQ